MSVNGKADRRAVKAAYRERKQDWSICAVRIGGQAWVKLHPDPRAFENRIGFSLRQRGAPAPGMLAAWDSAGEVTVEVLERLDPKLSEMARERVGEARLAHWAAALGATAF